MKYTDMLEEKQLSNRRGGVWDFLCRLKTTLPVPHPLMVYLFIDLMKVTMKTAEMSIRRPVATKPSPMKMMVPRLA
jgi:hypothetical protein